MLVEVNMAEEGILRLLFTSVYQIFCKTGSDNEVALASRYVFFFFFSPSYKPTVYY